MAPQALLPEPWALGRNWLELEFWERGFPRSRRVRAGVDDGGGVGAQGVRVDPKPGKGGGRRSQSVALDDPQDPVHIFADVGVDSRHAFLAARPYGPPGHQALKDSSAHQWATRVALEAKAGQRSEA